MDQQLQQTDDLEQLVREALVKLVSEQSNERLNKLCKHILHEFKNDFDQSVHMNGTRLFNGEHIDLDQMTIDELGILKDQLIESINDKKDKLFKQSTIGTRLTKRLTQIYELIERNEEKIKEHLDNDDQSCESNEIFDGCVDRWRKEKEMINEKFQIINNLLSELEN